MQMKADYTPTEILAPAGDRESAYAAINSGADAIYLGLTSFSARSSAKNFDIASLERLISYAHALGVKIYVAMNTLVKDGELEDFVNNAVSAHNAGADAIIIQDIFLGKYLKQTYPQLCLHLSTQAGVNNVYGAMLAREYGFDRVILARETGIEDIKKITKIIQTEVFVQGALCSCFSGQCYLSSFAGGNSGNRGKCKQPCRKLYSIDRKGWEDKAYRISLSDLSVGVDIEKLIEAGVYSFKIEGRMRRPEYVSAAVSYYRNIIGGKAEKADLSALKRTYNRGNYTKGLAFGQDKTFLSSAVQGHIGEYCGAIKVINGRYLCLSDFKCAEGDCFKILRDGKEVCGASFAGAAKGGFYLSSSERLKNGDKAFITTDARLNERLLQGKRLKKIDLYACFAAGERAKVTLDGREYESEYILQPALNRPLTKEDIERCFKKVDAYPFEISVSRIEIIGASFVPASALNAFRRQVFEDYFKSLSRTVEKIESIQPLPQRKEPVYNAKTAVISSELCGVRADIGILKPDDYTQQLSEKITGFSGEKYLFLPPFLTGGEIEAIKPELSAFDGIYCDGYYAIELCKETGKKLFAGSGFNIGNYLSLAQVGAEYTALSKELTVREAKAIATSNCFYLTAGDLKVMDLIYCPFSRSCKNCDKRSAYTLTDEQGRAFPLRRYSASLCRFEVYNCSPLVAENNFTGALADCTLCDAKIISQDVRSPEKLKKHLTNYTKGHSVSPVL
ncbi:MAG: U32 family peptidase [Candidatus Coproplasma sp.]